MRAQRCSWLCLGAALVGSVLEVVSDEVGVIPAVEEAFPIEVQDRAFSINGEVRETLALQRGKTYRFDGSDELNHPFYISSTSGGGTQGSNSYDGSRLCVCPKGLDSKEMVAVRAVVDGSIYFQPTDDDPDKLWYNCMIHDNMGGTIQISSYEGDDAVQAEQSEIWDENSGGNVCGWCKHHSFRRPAIILAHGACMFTAFGFILPVGAFLAYTGFHKYHMCFQVTGVTIGICGAVCGIIFAHPYHATLAHHFVGFFILVMALFIQPLALALKHREVHHKNGAAIVGFGLMNIFFGLNLMALGLEFLLSYALYLAFLVVMFIFDPLQLREKRLIEIAKIKKRGGTTEVDIAATLLIREAHAQFPEARPGREKWETEIDEDGGVVTYLQPDYIGKQR